jgi:hypothetical protein
MAENLKISLKLDTPEVKVQANVPTIIDGNINSQPKINFVSVGQRGSVGPAGPAGTITAEQQAAINANTAKVGITTEQANAITVNTSKVGITTQQADAISANTSKVGITSSQASAIVANTAKNSYPDADSTKLAGIQAGAEVNVQADFNETDSNSDAFIKNKPTDTNTTYSISCVDGDNTDEEKIRLTDSSGTNDDIVLEAGTGLSIARSGDKITFTNTVTDTDTVLTTEQVQDIVGAMFSSNTETRISATYQDDDGTIDLVVDDMTADTNTNVGNTDLTLSGSRSINTSDNTFQIKNGSSVFLEFDDSGITTFIASSDLDIGAHQIRASKFQSDVATGTAPFTVASTTAVANLQAATATTLHTARNIGGVSFDGSSDIDLPGVNTTGNQNTTGNAATASIAQRITGPTDSDVIISSDGEVTIKLDSDDDESNQKFKITNNADTEVFSVQEDGVVNMAGGTINVGGSNSNFELNAGSDIILEADNNGGGNTSTIQYPDSGGTNRIILGADSDVAILSNRASNGTVQIRANTSTAGSSGEVTVVTVEDDSVTTSAPLFINAGGPNVAITCTSSDADCMVRVSDNSTAGTNVLGMVGTADDLVMRNDEGNFKVKMANNATETLNLDQSGNLTVTGIITGKQREIYSQSFLDDLGTTKHYLPWKDINEQTTVYQEEAAMVMPCDGRIVSVTVRMASITGDGNMTIGIETIAPNVNQFGSANWTSEETESLAVTGSDDYHVFHFAFDNAKHFDSGDLVSLSIQNDADLSGTTYFYVSTVVEYDWNTFLGTTSAEHDSNP